MGWKPKENILDKMSCESKSGRESRQWSNLASTYQDGFQDSHVKSSKVDEWMISKVRSSK